MTLRLFSDVISVVGILGGQGQGKRRYIVTPDELKRYEEEGLSAWQINAVLRVCT